MQIALPRRCYFLWIPAMCAFALTLSPVAYAQQSEPVDTDNIKVCAQLQDPVDRLNCYDKVATLDETKMAQTDKQRESLPVPENEQLKPKESAQANTQTDMANFGINMTLKDETYLHEHRLVSKIVGVQKTKQRRTNFVLANGQIWELLENIKIGLPKKGDSVIIRQEALGGFYLRKEGLKTSLRVTRRPHLEP